jgi:nitrogen-specific signal transduction histidine kinase
MNSLILVIGTDQKLHVSFEYQSAPSPGEATSLLQSQHFPVIIVQANSFKDEKLLKLFEEKQERWPFSQVILVVTSETSDTDLQNISARLILHRALSNWNGAELSDAVFSALEKTAMQAQESDLSKLVQSQTEKLKSAYDELEERVEKRQKFLLESRRKIHSARVRWESLRQALLSIHKAQSVSEMEMNLLEFLKATMQVQAVRIGLKGNEKKELLTRDPSALRVFQAYLYQGDDRLGIVYYFRDLPFTKEETELLQKIADGLSLALNRLMKMEQAESLKDQWQVTFNAISDPAALINESYEVIQMNKAFADFTSNHTPNNPQKVKCYEALFQRETPCPNCKRSDPFRLDLSKGKNASYQVYSQQIRIDNQEDAHYFHIYHEITDQLKMERKILESARLAELGTIGSSIAHELNNPLGGMLSYLQLIKMDLKNEDHLYSDIAEMEAGVKRCRDIIENLLGFTRDPNVDQEKRIDLRDVILRSQKIIELQTKSWGIELKVVLPDQPCEILAHANLLSQALRNLVSACIQGLKETAKLNKSFLPHIEIHLSSHQTQYEISILDNGPGIQNAGQLQISVAGQIIHDYGGDLELRPSLGKAPSKLSMAKISLPRPVLQA